MKQSLRLLALTCSVTALTTTMTFSQNLSTSITARYRIVPNITYLTANNFDAKLDVYSRADTQTPQPTVIYIHGGGWTQGAKETQLFNLFPYLEMGWNAVNVEYRLARVSQAPALRRDWTASVPEQNS